MPIRKSGLVMVLIAIAGLASGPALAKEPRSVDLSPKSVQDLTACIVVDLAESRGYEIIKAPTLKGVEVKLRFRVVGVAATAATFDIEDLGDQRQLTIYATGKETGAPRVLASKARKACIEKVGS